MHVWMAFEQLFDVAGVHILTAADKHVVDPADEEVPTVCVAQQYVASVIPAVGQALLGHRRQVVVAVHHARAGHPQLALRGVFAGPLVYEPYAYSA